MDEPLCLQKCLTANRGGGRKEGRKSRGRKEKEKDEKKNWTTRWKILNDDSFTFVRLRGFLINAVREINFLYNRDEEATISLQNDYRIARFLSVRWCSGYNFFLSVVCILLFTFFFFIFSALYRFLFFFLSLPSSPPIAHCDIRRVTGREYSNFSPREFRPFFSRRRHLSIRYRFLIGVGFDFFARVQVKEN